MLDVIIKKKKPWDIIFGQWGAERRISALAAAILMLTVLLTGGVIFAVLAQQLRTQLENGLVRTLHDRSALFQHEVDRGVGIADGITSGRPHLTSMMSAFHAGTADKETRREIAMLLDVVRVDQKLSALALYDAQGEPVAGSGEFLRAPFAVVLRQPESASLLWRDGFYLALAATMWHNGAKVGTVRLEYPLVAMTRAFRDYRDSGKTGEIALCAALSDGSLRCFPTRHSHQPFDLARSVVGKPLPMSLALEGKSAVITTLDYRSHEVLDAFQPVGDSGLGMVVKIDTDELLQPIRAHFLWIGPFLAALLVLGFTLLRWQIGRPVREVVSARARLRGILDNSADGIVTVDEHGVVESCNFAAARIFGYPAFEIVGKSVNMLMPEPYRAGHDEGMRNYLRSGEPKMLGHGGRQVEGQRKDGTVFPLEMSLGEMLLDDRRVFIASLRDRSELKQSHAELESSVSALQAANRELEEAHVQLRQAELDKDRQMNALAEANVRMVLYHATMERVRHADASFCASGDADVFFHGILSDAMTLTGAKCGAVSLFDASGRLRQFLTEGMSAEEWQKTCPSPLGKCLLPSCDGEDPVMQGERIAEGLRAGFPSGDVPMSSLIGVPLNVNDMVRGVIYLTEKASGELFTDQDEMLVEMVAREVEHVLERSELMARLRDSNQALTREREEQQSLIVELKAAQSQLVQSEKMASIGQLAAGVAHEINNPIGYVHSNFGMLEKYISDLFSVLDLLEDAEGELPQDSSSLARIRASKDALDLSFLKQDMPSLMAESKEGITRVKKIVQDLKDFSHAGETEWQVADLHHGLDSTLNVVWHELKYKAKVVKEYGGLPEIECIPSQLNQVFLNLLVNAGHAIESGGTITIRTGALEDEIWVDIADNGKGIAPEHLERIFDPFFTTKPVGQGTGLGLSLSYGIVNKHHGRIEVDSMVGKGTTFRVCLPLKQAENGAVSDMAISREAQPSATLVLGTS